MFNFFGVFCFIGWMCRNRGICEFYLNLYYYIIYFNLYLLVKGLYFFINFELDF